MSAVPMHGRHLGTCSNMAITLMRRLAPLRGARARRYPRLLHLLQSRTKPCIRVWKNVQNPSQDTPTLPTLTKEMGKRSTSGLYQSLVENI